MNQAQVTESEKGVARDNTLMLCSAIDSSLFITQGELWDTEHTMILFPLCRTQMRAILRLSH